MILDRRNNVDDFTKIKQFAEENEIVGIVVGFPIGYEETCKIIQEFADGLFDFLEREIPITLFDESLSSFEAKEIHSSKLSRKKNKFVDDIAAAVILEHFLQGWYQIFDHFIAMKWCRRNAQTLVATINCRIINMLNVDIELV